MGNYIPSTGAQQREMLEAIGLNSVEELYSAVPSSLIITDGLKMPGGKSELEVQRIVLAMAAENTVYPSIFRGAGAYNHYIPSIVPYVVSKETFLTAYTPYQAEISQGILQSIFEYQTMICELTGMDASNASVYDGATAAAEAVAMCRDRKRKKALVSAACDPAVIEIIRTYCWAADTEVELIPHADGKTDLDALSAMIDDKVSCVYLHQPNYFGILEDCEKAGGIIHEHGAKFIMGVHPLAVTVLKTPGECGADIAVGDAQPLGLPLSFGGPYVGFMAVTAAMTRKLPGRIAGETFDAKGNRAYVLTLQAREQHIRREKASSNICSNQALCAMTVAVYLSAMGPHGVRQAALQSTSKAHYLASELEKIGFTLLYQSDYFNEFVTCSPVDIQMVTSYLGEHGILGGLPAGGGILWCATEMNTKEEIDRMIRLIRKIAQKEAV